MTKTTHLFGRPGGAEFRAGSRVTRTLPALALLLASGCTEDELPDEAGEDPRITVTGPITTGSPARMPMAYDLAAYGYVEEEFFFEGTATAYALLGDAPRNGRLNAIESSQADYKSRLVVYRPTDATKFNGTVLLEWFNVSGGIDYDPGLRYNLEELLREGYAFVGVSAQAIGVEGGGIASILSLLVPDLPKAPKEHDPVRYGSLYHPGDQYSYDIFTQAAELIRKPGPIDVLDGLRAKHLIAYGESQSAARLATYVNAVHPLVKVYDGFFIHSRGPGGPTLEESDGNPSGIPALLIRTDVDVPVFQFQTETDVLGLLAFLPSRQPDSDRIRTWEVAGTAHADAQITPPGLGTGCSTVNDGPQQYVVKAAVHALNRWVVAGIPPPRADPLASDSEGAPLRDEHGIIRGGVRTPDVDVPVAIHNGLGGVDTGDLLCDGLGVLFGQSVPFPPEKLKALYSSHEDYVSQVRASARAAREAGFLLPPEEQAMVAEAEAFAFPD